MINHKLKAIFIHVPKCGGTSVECVLQNESFVYQQHYHTPHSELNENHGNYFKFAFVRNPYDKLVSEYKWFTNNKHKYPRKQVKDFYKDVDFKTFLKIFTNWSESKSNHDPNKGDYYHGLDYMQILQPIDQINFIGRFENLQQDFDTVCDKIGIDKQQLPHKNKTKHKHYTEYYDDETRKIVRENTQKILKCLGINLESENIIYKIVSP